MRKWLAILLLCLLLALTGCGAQPGQTEPEMPAQDAGEMTAETLPESCRRWFDVAALSGAAEDDSPLPLAEEAEKTGNQGLSVRIPDGTEGELRMTEFGEGRTIEELTDGGARFTSSYGRVAWNGQRYDALTISARDCTLPNLIPTGGCLRLDIAGECTISGGGESCLDGYDCVLITGDGTLTFEGDGLLCGGDSFDLPALIVDGSVTVIASGLELRSSGSAPAYVQLGGTVLTDRLRAEGGEVVVADGTLLARTLQGAADCTFRGGVTLVDDCEGGAATVVLSGGAAYFANELPQGTVVESGAGTLAAANIAAVTVHTFDGTVLDNERDGSSYYQTAYSEEWCPDDGSTVRWDSLCVDCTAERFWFAGALALRDAAAENIQPWGSLHLALQGENRLSGELGGASLLLTGDGSLEVGKLSLWGWGSVTHPVLVIRDGARITSTGGEEVAIGSNAEQEGLVLLEDGTLTVPALWLQNAALVVESGTLHVTGSCALERGSATVTGGTVVLDEGLWLGEGDITVTGGEIIVPGGEEALSLDNGTVTVTGGTIREP